MYRFWPLVLETDLKLISQLLTILSKCWQYCLAIPIVSSVCNNALITHMSLLFMTEVRVFLCEPTTGKFHRNALFPKQRRNTAESACMHGEFRGNLQLIHSRNQTSCRNNHPAHLFRGRNILRTIKRNEPQRESIPGRPMSSKPRTR